MLENFSGATRLYPVVGDPIAQVKSPYGVTQAFEARGIDAICVPMQVAPADFRSFMQTMRATKNVDGVIITVPHKFSAHDVCNNVSERAAFLKSVNSIRRMADGSWDGDMFDGLGFVSACQDNGCEFSGKRALLVGAGGAGTAIAHAVAVAGVKELRIADVDAVRRDELIARLRQAGFPVAAGEPASSGSDIILNATPMGMKENDPLPIDLSTLHAGMFVGDVVTKPEIPPLIARAMAVGCKSSNGVAMFVKVRDLMVDFLIGRT